MLPLPHLAAVKLHPRQLTDLCTEPVPKTDPVISVNVSEYQTIGGRRGLLAVYGDIAHGDAGAKPQGVLATVGVRHFVCFSI